MFMSLYYTMNYFIFYFSFSNGSFDTFKCSFPYLTTLALCAFIGMILFICPFHYVLCLLSARPSVSIMGFSHGSCRDMIPPRSLAHPNPQI